MRTFAGGILAVTAFLFVLFIGCGDEDLVSDPPGGDPPDGDPPGFEEMPGLSLPEGFVAELFAEDLNLPTQMEFPPDGTNRLFVNELQTGRIRIVEDGDVLDEPFAELGEDLNVGYGLPNGFPTCGENGLLGLAFDPDFETNGHVYVTYAKRLQDDCDIGGQAHQDIPAVGAVARFTDANHDNRAEDFKVLLDSIPSQPGHQIQDLAFGPDGKLYVSVGDAYQAEAAQDTSAFVGKVLRMNPDGTIPADNPFPESYAYALGVRNGFDLVFDANGELYMTDNGKAFTDRLNRIVAGGNYGWGAEDMGSNPAFIDPVYVWENRHIAPTGLLFYDGDQFPAAYQGALFVVLFGQTNTTGPSERAKRVQVMHNLDAPGDPSPEDFAVYEIEENVGGNPTDITQGPDGSLYLSDIFRGQIYRIRYEE